MHHQRNPYPTDWWAEKVCGLSRDAWALILIGAVLALGFCVQNWDWVLGLR